MEQSTNYLPTMHERIHQQDPMIFETQINETKRHAAHILKSKNRYKKTLNKLFYIR